MKFQLATTDLLFSSSQWQGVLGNICNCQVLVQIDNDGAVTFLLSLVDDGIKSWAK